MLLFGQPGSGKWARLAAGQRLSDTDFPSQNWGRQSGRGSLSDCLSDFCDRQLSNFFVAMIESTMIIFSVMDQVGSAY